MDAAEQKSALAARRSDRCARCGVAFECGAAAGAETCWCMALPPLAATPDPTLGCLCPDCLKVALAEAGRLSG